MESTGLSSQLKPEEKQPEDLPLITYSGKIQYCTTLIDCAMTCDVILNKVKESVELLVIGFDLEWPFSYQTGSGRTAVIQVSPSLNECYIWHVSQMKNLPKSLTELIAHPNVRLAGVNIKNDVRKLARDFCGVDVGKVLSNCVDAGTQANNLLGCKTRWSMKNLVAKFFKMQISKDKKVRNSKWHIIPLSGEQQRYAATDSYVSLMLYFHLKDLENAQINKENESKT